MRHSTSILTISACAIVVASSPVVASSSIPTAEPINYVRICDSFGRGYHYIPGTETCLKFSGYVRAEIGLKDTSDDDSEDLSFYDREIELVIDAASMTEIGMVIGRFVLNNNKNDTVSVRDAWIKIGESLLVGRERSQYDFSGGYGMYDGYYADEALNQFTFFAPLGDDIRFSLGVEDGRNREANIAQTSAGTGFSKNVSYAGMKIPDVVASLRISQAWGSAQVSGAVHQIRANADAGVFEDFGFAAQAGAEFRPNRRTRFKFVAAYADGAMHYVGGDDFYEAQLSDTSTEIDETLNGWYVLAGLNQRLTKTVSLETTASFHDFVDQAEVWQLGATLFYQPTRELRIRFGAMYEGFDYDDTILGNELNDGDDDNWEVKLRVQRNF